MLDSNFIAQQVAVGCKRRVVYHRCCGINILNASDQYKGLFKVFSGLLGRLTDVLFAILASNLKPSSRMRIYKDIFTGDEMFSDTYKIKLVDDVLYEVYGKLITRKQGDVQIEGFNPSAEEASEGTDEAVESGVDIVLNHRLTETYAFGDKKSFTAYLKEYMKKLVQRLEEKSPDEVSVFKNNTNKVMKDILGRFKDLQFYTGESMDIDGMVAMLEYRDIDGDSVPVLMCFRHGLDEEKF